MESLKNLFKIGRGPSSSHTMGPQKAAQLFAKNHRDAKSFNVTLYGSLAATGKGHMTDIAINDILSPIAPLLIDWKPKIFLPFHPNGMKFESLDNERITDSWTVYSIGGGTLSEGKGENDIFSQKQIYRLNSIKEILKWCENSGKNYWEYVEECETKDIWDYMDCVWQTMKDSVVRGLNHEGVLPGPLHLTRKASTYYIFNKKSFDSY